MSRDEFGSSGRCGCSFVSHKVCDGEISFVAHCRDHWNCRSTNRARDLLLIKCPEIFGRSSATTNNKYIDEFSYSTVAESTFVIIIYQSDRSRDIASCSISLNACWREKHVHGSCSPGDHAEDVANGSSSR